MLKQLRLIFVFAFLTLIALSGLYLGGLASDRVLAFARERYQDLQLFTKVLNLVQQYYVEPVDTKKLIYGGVKGMLKELDPHTNFLPPEIYKEFESETSGEFGGLGLEITIQKGVLTVISPIEDTPAWKAGIKSGDRIVSINGDSTKGLSLAEAAQKMRGKKNTAVKLGVFREGFETPKVFAVKRGVVKIKSVKYIDLKEGYGYVRMTSFIEKTYKDLVKILDKHQQKHKKIKGLIIDLRRNPGGLLDQAVKISDLFLDSGTIVSTVGRNKKEKEVQYAKKEGAMTGFPIIVLIDEYSASASEILAGALQDNHRALVMGQRSFGKGSVQSVVKLGDGSGLKLTVARYYTPSGRSIQAEGIRPDMFVERLDSKVLEQARTQTDVRREKDIKGHLLGDSEQSEEPKSQKSKKIDLWWTKSSKNKKLTKMQSILKNDFQVLQAYNYLRAWKVMKEVKQ